MAKTVGLTGGIGSGKSFVSKIFQLMGIPVYNSDINAKVLMVENKVLVKKLRRILGDAAYREDGSLDRAFIAAEIFNNAKKLEAVNAAVHPAVREDFQKFAKLKQKKPYVINEAALFVENGSYKDFSALISVLSPWELRVSRTLERDGSSRKEVLARMKNQSADEDKIKVSDHLIYNDGFTNLFHQVTEIHHKLLEL